MTHDAADDAKICARWKFATLALSAVLICLQLWHVAFGVIGLDDSYFGLVARNLVSGRGYSAVYYAKDYPFHFGITAGPTIILPAALLIWIFGNQHWVLGATETTLIWCLLLAIIRVSGEIFAQTRKWQFCFIALATALLLTAGDSFSFGFEMGDRFILWYLLLGDIPSALCIVLAVFTLFCKPPAFSRIATGSLFLGLAMLTKSITAIAAVISIVLLSYRLLLQVRSRKTQCFYFLAALFFSLLPLALFEAAKILCLGWQAYFALQAENLAYYKHAALLISTQENSHMVVKPDILLQLAFLCNLIGPCTTVLILACVVYCAVLFCRQYMHQKSIWASVPPVAFIGAALLLCFLAQLIWWLRLAQPGADRYIVTGLVYFSAGFACMFVWIPHSKMKKEFLMLFVMAICLENFQNIEFFFYKGFAPSHKLDDKLALAEKLTALDAQHVPLFACNSEYRMEYLMPGFDHLRDCRELVAYNFERPAALFMFFLKPGKTYHQSAHGSYYVAVEPFPPEVVAMCGHEIFNTNNTSLRLCDKPVTQK